MLPLPGAGVALSPLAVARKAADERAAARLHNLCSIHRATGARAEGSGRASGHQNSLSPGSVIRTPAAGYFRRGAVLTHADPAACLYELGWLPQPGASPAEASYLVSPFGANALLRSALYTSRTQSGCRPCTPRRGRLAARDLLAPPEPSRAWLRPRQLWDPCCMKRRLPQRCTDGYAEGISVSRAREY